jgi:hypothetical protein
VREINLYACVVLCSVYFTLQFQVVSYMMWFIHLLVFDHLYALVRMVGDGTFMGMMNESQENHGLNWDGVGSPPEEQQHIEVYNTPMTQG